VQLATLEPSRFPFLLFDLYLLHQARKAFCDSDDHPIVGRGGEPYDPLTSIANKGTNATTPVNDDPFVIWNSRRRIICAPGKVAPFRSSNGDFHLVIR
jgi:hypothetical protein